jgi:DME family drug/metabolite transporter
MGIQAGEARRAFALVLGAGILWGTTGVAAQLALDATTLDVFGLVWLRSAVAALACLAIAGADLRHEIRRSSRGDLVLMGAIGIVLLLSQGFYIGAVESIGVTAATLIALCVPPVLVAVVSTLAFGETMSGPVLAALVGALVGTVLLVGAPGPATGTPGGGPLPGVLLALGAAVAIATHTLGSRRLAGRHRALVPPAVGFAVAVLLSAPLAVGRGIPLALSLEGWLLVLYLGVAPAALASLMFQRGLRHVPASTATIVILVEPLTAALLAWVLFDERLGPLGLLGGALLIAAILVLTRRPAAPATASGPVAQEAQT